MENITIKETSKTPLIQFDTSNHTIRIEGKIIAENPITFFGKLDEIIDNYAQDNKAHTLSLNVYVDYFNTVCTKYFLKFLRKVISSKEDSSKININWHYDADDTEIKESGEDYAMILNHNFNFLEVKN